MSAQHFLGSVRPWVLVLQCLQHRRVVEALHINLAGLGNNRFRKTRNRDLFARLHFSAKIGTYVEACDHFAVLGVVAVVSIRPT